MLEKEEERRLRRNLYAEEQEEIKKQNAEAIAEEITITEDEETKRKEIDTKNKKGKAKKNQKKT